MNAELCRWLGYTIDALENKPVSTVMVDGELIVRGETIKSLMTSYSVEHYRVHFIQNTGAALPVLFSGTLQRRLYCPNYPRPDDQCRNFKQHQVHCQRITGLIGTVKSE